MKKDILNAISSVIDPEVGFNILDLGLIYDIKINDDKCEIFMTLSTKSCPMHELIITWVKNAVAKVDGINSVNINLVWQPSWNIEMASDNVKSALNI